MRLRKHYRLGRNLYVQRLHTGTVDGWQVRLTGTVRGKRVLRLSRWFGVNGVGPAAALKRAKRFGARLAKVLEAA